MSLKNMRQHRFFQGHHPWSLRRMLWNFTWASCGIIVFTMWFGMNSDRDNVHPIITQIMPAGHCTCQTATVFQCAECLSCPSLSSSPATTTTEEEEKQQPKWKFEYGRDDRNLGLGREQCQSAFPGLFQDVIRAGGYWRSQGGVSKEDLDAISLQPGMARALIQDGELYVVAARASNEDHRRKILAALSSMHRTLTASHASSSATTTTTGSKNIEFIFSVEDRVDDVHGGGQPIWTLARKASEQSAWLMPDFGFWAWEHWRQDIGPYNQAVDRVLATESRLAFGDKARKLVWRGKLSFAPKLRRGLMDAARNQTWGDVRELDWSRKENFLSLEDHCRYMFIAHVEGIPPPLSHGLYKDYANCCRPLLFSIAQIPTSLSLRHHRPQTPIHPTLPLPPRLLRPATELRRSRARLLRPPGQDAPTACRPPGRAAHCR